MKQQGVGNREQGVGLWLVRKPVGKEGLESLREGSTGRLLSVVRPVAARSSGIHSVLPRVWAVAEVYGGSVGEVSVDGATEGAVGALTRAPKCEGPGAPRLLGVRASLGGSVPLGVPAGSPAASVSEEVEVAFYRKYTEAMLRRYLRLSMAAGRVPSLMGRELFRGHVTKYKVTNFEDVVIFCHDVEKCLKVLDGREKELIKRVTLQSYSQGEAAAILGMSLRSCVRMYAQTLDKLTRVLLAAKLMQPLGGCQ